jgi:YfiH family protein
VARQVHGTRIVAVDPPAPGAFLIAGEADGLACGGSGLLLAVTAADCVPLYIVDEANHAFAILHAGWRGVVAGILDSGLEALAMFWGTSAKDVLMHLGPAICGDCYEVGEEVLTAFGRTGEVRGHVDLRGELARQAVSSGVPPDQVTSSGLCTLCGTAQLHTYRGQGKAAGRQAAFLGWRQG